MRILLVEDDEVLVDVLRRSLTSQHYVVDAIDDGQQGWEYAQTTEYDLILLDVELPHLDGVALCQRLRDRGCTAPILLITARDASHDRIRGLDAGADDYLVKPLDLGELQARVRALLRRGDVAPTPVLQVGALRLDPRSCEVSYGGKPLTLTPKEYSLLELFLRNPSRVYSRGQIVEHLWTFDDPPLEESVKGHIKGLRMKLKTVGAADWIENVYGIGYRLKEGVGKAIAEDRPHPPTHTVTPPATAAPTTAIEQQFNQAREVLWQRYHDVMTQRLTVLQAAATAAKTGTLADSLRQAAGQAAHKLAGVLGMFDRDAGTDIARSLEHLLATDGKLTRIQKTQLQDLVNQLSEVLNLTEPDSPSCTSVSQATLEPAPAIVPATASPLTVKILVVDDDPLFLAALPPMLEPWGLQVSTLENPLQIWDSLAQTQPDLLILDVEMPQISGIEICQSIRHDPHWQSLPVLFLTAHHDRQTVQQVFAAGADDYVSKPIVGAELLTRITNRLERIRLLQSLTHRDPLTGLTNQPQSSRVLEMLLNNITTSPEKQTTCLPHSCLSLVVLTVTNLRQINLQYGHNTGNQVLQRWGQLLRSTFSDSQGLGYWGNGEFVVGLSGMTRPAATHHLAELQITLRQQVFTATTGDRFQTIFSLGIAEYPTDGQTLQSLYQVANSPDSYG